MPSTSSALVLSRETYISTTSIVFPVSANMEAFRYDNLDLEGSAFRLFCLGKGEGHSIHGELFQALVQERDNAVSYEALSYTWGSKETTDEIIVDGKHLNITHNLYVALQHLRLRDR